jgi:hypothetical protein
MGCRSGLRARALTAATAARHAAARGFDRLVAVRRGRVLLRRWCWLGLFFRGADSDDGCEERGNDASGDESSLHNFLPNSQGSDANGWSGLMQGAADQSRIVPLRICSTVAAVKGM